MPRTTDRPRRLADAAIAVMARDGLHGVTHRTVDAEAGMPPGTASYHFRSRRALLESTALRLRDLHVSALTQALSAPRADSWEQLVSAMTDLVEATDEAMRTRYLAFAELMLEATRDAALATIVNQVRESNLEFAATLLRKRGVAISGAQLTTLGSLLTGVTLERIALSAPGASTSSMVDTVLRCLVADHSASG